MIDGDLKIIVLSVEIALYLVLVAVALRRGALRDGLGRSILLYALVLAMWEGEQLAWRLGWDRGMKLFCLRLLSLPRLMLYATPVPRLFLRISLARLISISPRRRLKPVSRRGRARSLLSIMAAMPVICRAS